MTTRAYTYRDVVPTNPPTFQTLILDNSGVCSNCFGLRSHNYPEWEPNRPQTVKGYPPSNPPGSPDTWYCVCGVESAFMREWGDPERPAMDRFRELIKRCIRTIEKLGYVVDRERFVSFALVGFTMEDLGINESFAKGFRHGVLD